MTTIFVNASHGHLIQYLLRYVLPHVLAAIADQSASAGRSQILVTSVRLARLAAAVRPRQFHTKPLAALRVRQPLEKSSQAGTGYEQGGNRMNDE
ncbi:hypothetical protein BH11PSE11_BH11PSE11_10400 [soil metagenome]